MENTITKTKITASDEIRRFSLNVGIAASALIGIWGFACLIGGLVNGPNELISGFLQVVGL